MQTRAQGLLVGGRIVVVHASPVVVGVARAMPARAKKETRRVCLGSIPMVNEGITSVQGIILSCLYR